MISGRGTKQGRIKGSSSFLKKRTKKLLFLGNGMLRSSGWPGDRTRHDDGFTLMEVMIAVVVLGFIMVGLSQAQRFGIGAWSVQAKLAMRAADMERVDRVLRLVISEASAPLSGDDKPFVGQEHRFLLVTRLPDQPPTQPVRRAQVAIGVNEKNQLVMNWQPHANAIAIIPPPIAPPIVLLEGVDHIDVTYQQSEDDGGKVMSRWDDSSLPALVLIHIVMKDSRRTWPVVQVATMLDTDGSF
jgi:general secretion pathway protein J